MSESKNEWDGPGWYAFRDNQQNEHLESIKLGDKRSNEPEERSRYGSPVWLASRKQFNKARAMMRG